MRKLLTFFLGCIAIPLLLLLSYFESRAQTTLPIKWPQKGTWNGFELVVNEDPANIILTYTNTTLKKLIPKTSFSNMTIVLDPKQSADYQNLAAALAETINARDGYKLQLQNELNENADLRRQMSDLIAIVKQLKYEKSLDTIIYIKVRKGTKP